MATATESTILEAQSREPGTKNDARRVRREGKVPGSVVWSGQGFAVGQAWIHARSREFCTRKPATTPFSI